MCTVIHHSGELTGSLPQHVVLQDDAGHTSHSHVLLSTGIDGRVLAHVDGTTHDVRRHIGNQWHGHIGILAQLCAKNGVV